MAETLRELVVALSLVSSNFSRNMRTINQQIKKAESTFRLAGAGVQNYEKTIAGTEAKLSDPCRPDGRCGGGRCRAAGHDGSKSRAGAGTARRGADYHPGIDQVLRREGQHPHWQRHQLQPHHCRCAGHNAGVRSQRLQQLAGREDRKSGRMGFRGVQRNHK